MTEYKDQFNAKDFWPDAEQMLDAHFRRKRIIRYSLVAAALVVTSAVVVFLFNREELTLSVFQTSSVSKTKNAEQSNPTETPKYSATQEETKLENRQNFNADNKSQNTPTLKKETTPIANVNQASDSAPEVENQKSPGIKSEGKKLNTKKWSETAKPQNTSKLPNSVSQSGPEKEALYAGNKANEPVIVNQNTRIEKPENLLNTGKNNNSSIAANSNLAEINAKNSGGNQANKTGERITAPEIENLFPLNFLSEKNPQELISGSPIESIKSQSKLRNSATYVEVRSGLFYHQARHFGGTTTYQNRRSNEERADLSWIHSLQISKSLGNWRFNSGIELSSYGEKTQYNNWVDGLVTTLQNGQQIVSDSLLSTRFNYYLGNEFTESVIEVVSDTLITQDTLKVAGTVAGNLPDGYSNGRNRYRYFEIPVSIGYRLMNHKRFNLRIQAGISAAFLQGASGFMLNPNNTAFLRLEEAENLQRILWNFRGGLRFDYAFINGISVFAQAEYRGMLNSVFQNASGLNSRYSSVGISLGLGIPITQKP